MKTSALGPPSRPIAQEADLGPPGPPAPRRRPAWVGLAVVAAALACLVSVLVLHRSALGASLAALRHLKWSWLAVGVAAETVSLVVGARGHRRLLRAGGATIRLRSVLAVGSAGTAIAFSVPFGIPAAAAYAFRQYRSRGIDLAVASWAFAVSWMIANTTFALVLAAGSLTAGGALAAAAGLAAAAVFLTPAIGVFLALRFPAARRVAHRLTAMLVAASKKLIGRPRTDLAAAVESLLEGVTSVRMGPRHYAEVFACSLCNWLFDIACFASVIHATGSPIPWHGLLLAYGAGMTAGGLLGGLSPGGLGIIEAALSAALVAAGLQAGRALSAVLVYRLISFWLLLAAGWVVMALLTGRRRPPREPAPALP